MDANSIVILNRALRSEKERQGGKGEIMENMEAWGITQLDV